MVYNQHEQHLNLAFFKSFGHFETNTADRFISLLVSLLVDKTTEKFSKC